MKPIVTAIEMREIDAVAISGNIDVGYGYMKLASDAVSNEAIKMVHGDIRRKIAILCGKGNNGGDGYLTGAILTKNGFNATCFAFSSKSDLKDEALRAYCEFENVGEIIEIIDGFDYSVLRNYEVIVDALLGTGAKRELGGEYQKCVDSLNELDVNILAVDTPTGTKLDVAEVNDCSIKATATVTMGFEKLGHTYYPLADFVGELVIADLGYSKSIISKIVPSRYVPEDSDYKKMLPNRKSNGSKKEHGLAGVVAGSVGMCGAPTLAMNAALKTGCGMVIGFIPKSIMDIMSVKVTEPVLISCGSKNQESHCNSSLDLIIDRCEKISALLIGPGLLVDSDTQKLVRGLYRDIKLPVVLDADGINAFRDRSDEFLERENLAILTPHAGEYRRVFGEPPLKPEDLVAHISNSAVEHNIIIVYKGKPTIICDNVGNSYVLNVGDSSLATAGTGDILSGIILSLIAQGASLVDAAILGVKIHGDAGKIAGEELTQYSTVASDIVDRIGTAIKIVTT